VLLEVGEETSTKGSVFPVASTFLQEGQDRQLVQSICVVVSIECKEMIDFAIVEEITLEYRKLGSVESLPERENLTLGAVVTFFIQYVDASFGHFQLGAVEF
jgi:hypothetical protein